MPNNHLADYRRAQILGMSQVELVVFLYESAIRNLHEAIDLVTIERFDQSWKKFDSARRIVIHLCGTLNREAGDITDKLTALYAFVIEQITIANARREPQPARDCIDILTTLKEGWEGLAGADAPVQSEDGDSVIPAAGAPRETGQFRPVSVHA